MEKDIYVVEVLADSGMDDYGTDSVWTTYKGARAMYLTSLGRDCEVIHTTLNDYSNEWPYEDYKNIKEYLKDAVNSDEYSIFNGETYFTTRISTMKLNKKYE